MTNNQPTQTAAERLRQALTAEDSSDRLQAALTAGTRADSEFASALIERCGEEPDFYVRDMLTWALTRLPRDVVLPRVLAELNSERAQARSQALHTLSKLGDPASYEAIRTSHLHDPDDEIARAAWRAAAGLVPFEAAGVLAAELAQEFGRGDLVVQRSLSRALVELGEHAQEIAERVANGQGTDRVRIHAQATLRLIDDPEASFTLE
ncbi:MAG: HEAT repeat domain-containing protein [Leucobacter sp.]